MDDNTGEVVASRPPRNRKARSKRKRHPRPGGGVVLTEQELAKALGERVRTIRTLDKNGIIPHLHLGHRTKRYLLDSVLAALQKREHKRRRF
jgi:hypothetical protein